MGHSSENRVHYSVWYIEICKYVFHIMPIQQHNKNEQNICQVCSSQALYNTWQFYGTIYRNACVA